MSNDPPERQGAVAALPPEQTELTPNEPPQPLLYPFTFNATYYYYSDYIFRGVNYSEYATEGREKPNHQLTTRLGVDVAGLFGGESGSAGTFAFSTFFQWYAAQQFIDANPDTNGKNLQEIDYALSWAYEIKPLKTTITPSYTWYTYPRTSETSFDSQEWAIRLDHNDAWMWKWLWPENEAGVLNPYFSYAHTVTYAAGAKWAEFGISHPFTLAEGLTLTPSLVLAYQGEYYARQLKRGPAYNSYAYTQFGANLTYDLAKPLKLDPRAGSIPLSVFLYYNEANQTLENDGFVEDEFFGGVSIGWSF